MTATRFQSALIAEDDDMIRSFIDQSLRELGYMHISKASNGEQAWELATKRKYDIIISDWKMPKVHGLAFLNRLRRSKQYSNVPVLIVSGFLNRKDFTLLEEFALTEKLEKPFAVESFHQAVRNLEKEFFWLQSAKTELNKIIENPIEDQKHYILRLLELVQGAPNPIPFFLLGARILTSRGDFSGAESIMRFAIKHSPNSTMAMFELAKILLKLNRNHEAFDLLLRAQEQSPDNLDRVCMLGHMHLNQLEPEEAKVRFSKALKIDPEDKLAKHGMTIAQNVDSFLTQNPYERLGQSFSTLLNTIGISLVRQGRIDEGIEHYKSAMAYVDDKNVKAKLSFNAALGNLRKKDFKMAKAWLDAAVGLNNNYPKAELYLNKIDQYLASDQRKIAFLPPSDAFDEIEGSDQDENLDFTLIEDESPPTAQKKPPAKKALVLEQGKEMSPKDIRKNLISACPHAQDVFKMLSKQGVNTLSLMTEFNDLYETFGPQLLDKAFRRAVREFDGLPAKVKAILEELAAA